jgi:AcrR family transcriptional regulator
MARQILTTIKNPDLIQQRQEQIFKAASKLFSKNGYHRTTLRMLSKETGIGLGNMYSYIANKKDILYLLYQKTAEIRQSEIDKRMRDVSDPWEKLKMMIDAEIETMNRYQDLVMVIYQESHAMDKSSMKSMLIAEEAHVRRYEKILGKGMALGIFKQCNSTALAHLIKMMVDGWVLKRWAYRGKVNLDEMKKLIISIVGNGILKSTKNIQKELILREGRTK